MASSTRMTLGQGMSVDPASRVTPYDYPTLSSASLGGGRAAVQGARYGSAAQRAPGRAGRGPGANVSAGRDASSPTNAALLGAASAHPPLFVRFECVHETPRSADRGDRRGDGGAGGATNAEGGSNPRPQTKDRVVDNLHSLSRALKTDPRYEAAPEELAEEDKANHVGGTSRSELQTYLCMFAITYPAAGWSRTTCSDGGGGGGVSDGLRRNSGETLDEMLANGSGGGRNLAAQLQASLAPSVYSPMKVWTVLLWLSCRVFSD